jgi:hypothetical protein
MVSQSEAEGSPVLLQSWKAKFARGLMVCELEGAWETEGVWKEFDGLLTAIGSHGLFSSQ